MASQEGHVDVVNILLQNGAHVDVQKEVSRQVDSSDNSIYDDYDILYFAHYSYLDRTSGLL